VILYSVLGESHPFVTAWKNFVLTFEVKARELKPFLLHPTTAGQLLRWLQIRCVNWFDNELDPRGRSPRPTSRSSSGTYATSPTAGYPHSHPDTAQIPLRLPQTRALRYAHPGVPPSPAPAVPPSSSGSSSSSNNTRIPNMNHRDIFQEFKTLGIPVKEVQDKAAAGGKPLPKHSQGEVFCLSYYVLGFYWESCRQKDHREHSAAEHQELLTWCHACWRNGGPQ
jgi:hypothetical protein